MVSEFSTETEPIGYTYEEIYFKELIHMIAGAGKFKYAGQANRLETRAAVNAVVVRQNYSLFGKI